MLEAYHDHCHNSCHAEAEQQSGHDEFVASPEIDLEDSLYMI
jgi:hypothetical protein